MTILEAAVRLRSRQVSSVELTREALDRIAGLNPRLNAFQTVTAERALADARQADQELAAGHDRGPLHGIPIGLKDVFSTKGIPTTCGSRLWADYIPNRDAAVVEKLAAAGAVLLGKTGMHELAYGITSNNPHFGAVRNPRDPERIPGGSSGGSAAAVASGMAFIAMGSDTGGSIRIPASFCGVVGLKPTFGLVSRRGVRPLDFSLDHMGPLARSVRDAAVVLEAIAGRGERYLPEAHPAINGLRVGVPDNFYFDHVDPEVAVAVRDMADKAKRSGAEVRSVEVPDIAAINTVGRVILLAEATALMEPYLDRPEAFGADVLALLQQGREIKATDYVNAQRLRRLYQRRFRAVWEQVDAILTPTTPFTAPRIGEMTVEGEDVRLAATRLVRGINVLGLPAISVPGGRHTNGLPMGMQIVVKPFAEAQLLRLAQALVPEEV